MVFNNQQLCALNEGQQQAMGCREQYQQQQQQHLMDKRSSSKVKGQRPSSQHKQLTKMGGGAGAKVGVVVVDDRTPHVISPASQEVKIPVYTSVGGYRTPPKGRPTNKSPNSRTSPGTMAMAAYAGAKFSAAPPSPHALPKPPVSWVNPVNSDASNGSPNMVNNPMMTSSSSYGNLISDQLKLLLNVQA